MITLRSGKQIPSPNFPPETHENPSSESTSKPSTSDPAQPSSSSTPPPSESGPSEEPEISEPSPPYKPPAPFPRRLASKKQSIQMEKILEIFKQVKVNIPLLDAVQQVPSHAKFLKDLCTHKRTTNVPKKAFLTANISSILSNQLPVKYKDPGCPTISCIIGDTLIDKALLDLRASVNLLPFVVYQQLGLGELKPMGVTLQLADRSIKTPMGIVEDDLIKVGEFVFPVDFIVLESQPLSDLKGQIPVIIGRPFLATSNALINCRNGLMELSLGNMTVELNIFHLGKQHNDYYENSLDLNWIQDLSTEHLEYLDQTSFYSEDESYSSDSVETACSSTSYNGWKIDPEPLIISTEPTPSSSSETTPRLELKPLPEDLKYAFLGPSQTLPVIITSDLNSTQEDALLAILKSNREAIGWSMTDIKGISRTIVQHRIHLTNDAKPKRDPQRRLNPVMKEVVRKEVLKCLDNGIIYPISDSTCVSPVQVVPKKSRITVVKNDNNKLIPTRIQTGWRVCIDYRKLNTATRKDHFPLPFIDQMLERLAGNEYY